MPSIEFRAEYKYGDSPGINIPIELGYGVTWIVVEAKIDTGADVCLFERDYGEQIGLDIEAGERKELLTLNGAFIVFGHEVSLRALGSEFHLVAYFPRDPNIRKSILGRQGWLNKVRIGIVDYERKVYLSHYDD